MTWRTEAWQRLLTSRTAHVSVANPTTRAIDAVLRLVFSTGRNRQQRETLAPGATFGSTIRTLMGSQASDADMTVTDLTVTCDGGAVACPVAITLLAAPTCVGD